MLCFYDKVKRTYLPWIFRSNKFRRFVSLSPPEHANVVIIGGGIIGNSVAYHLAQRGVRDILLIEQNKLTSGTTWHAAGLMVTFGSKSETSTQLRKYSKHLYATLEQETGYSTGFRPVGFIELATDKDRLEEYRRIAAFNRKCGVDVLEIGPRDVSDLFPLCRIDDVLAGFYVKDDGRVNPVDACMSLAAGARLKGVRYLENVCVSGVTTAPMPSFKRVSGVRLSDGHVISAETVVNCAGMWARQLGEASGVNIPNQAAEHYYLITDTMKEVDPTWPVVEDPANYAYIRPEGDGLMVGLFEGEAAPWKVAGIPRDFSFGEIEPDWDRMTPYVEKAMSRVPATLTSGVKKFFCGPESFTPDLSPIVGEAPELKNYFVAAGLNSIGILTGGGIGRLVADWIINGKSDMDITGMNIDRLHPYQNNPEYRQDRVVESLGQVYKCHYPYKSKETARGAKRSPFYDRMRLQEGAYMKDVSGWEAPDWFGQPPARDNDYPETTPKFGISASMGPTEHSWGRHKWFPLWQQEHRACREGVVVIDMSFMSKFLVSGRDAGVCLNRLSTANVNPDLPSNVNASGVITYTQWLNSDGLMEADLTVSKLGPEKFFVVATDTMHRHVETWLARNLDPEGRAHVFLTDVTGGYAQLNIQGPLSRQLMQRLLSSSSSSEDLSNDGFPFRCIREISIGYARVLCARITYVGELGYELFIPAEHAMHVYERILRAGEGLPLTHAGLKALGSLRMEKAYRDYGHDMDNTDTLLEVGLGFTADFNKPDGFIGKEAVLKQKKTFAEKGGLPKRLVQVLVLDPEPMMYHAEVLWRNGVIVGDVRAASYGHTLGGAVGLAMVDLTGPEHLVDGATQPVVNKSFIDSGSWEVEIGIKKYPVRVTLAPMYDPQNKKIKQ